LLYSLHGLGSEWVEHHVAADFQKVAFFLYQNGFVATLQKMSHRSVAPIVDLSVHTIELAHSFRKIRLRCFNHQVVVIVHQTVGVAKPVKAVDDLAEALQEGFAIPLILEDICSGVAPRGHMVNRTVKFHPERTSHGPS
jgi:hypothetical protein